MTTSTGALLFVLASDVVLLREVKGAGGEIIPAGARGVVTDLLGPQSYGETYFVAFEGYPPATVSEHEIELASGMQDPANDTGEAADEVEQLVPVIGPNGADLLVQRAVVLRALSDGRWARGRTYFGIADTTGVPRATVRFLLDVMPDYVSARPGQRRSFYTLTDAGRAALAFL
jgi:hypothetical protein